ncbi:MAG: hypothetical protein LQ338_001914 [Usnochroma carphineum]|nr:MAG: hypothetical protein LQ338_001914 [Usnochroma carphineum]
MSNHSLFSSLIPPLTRTTVRASSPLRTSRPFCSPCTPSASVPIPRTARPFTTTLHTLKKHGGKQHSKHTVSLNSQKKSSDDADPTDFSTLEAEIDTVVTKLREEIRRIKPGGVDVEAVENLRVTLKHSGANEKGAAAKGRKDFVKVGDLAQVVPRGRVLIILVGEKEHIKPLSAALASSPLSLNPLPLSPHTPLELHIPIPPTTTESRQAALSLVSSKGEKALFELREARGAKKKQLRQLQLGGKVGPDMLRRAESQLEKVNERGVGEVRKVVEAGRKGLGEGGVK